MVDSSQDCSWIRAIQISKVKTDRGNFLGRISEDFVERVLRVAGFTIIAKDINLKFTEIDIIAVRGDKLYVFEVRARNCNLQIRDVNNNLLRQDSSESNIWWRAYIDLYIDSRKIMRVLNGTLLVFNWYRKILHVTQFSTYLVLLCWENQQLYKVKFVNFLDLI